MDAQEIIGQDRNIVSSVSKRWDVNRQDTDPVEEILTKIASFHIPFQEPIRSANKSNIYSPVASSANPIELAILKQVQQLYLYGRVQVTDLVQKECAAVSKLYATRLRTIGASESAFFIAEEFALNQSPWDGRATDLHKRSVSQWRLGMNQLGKHFLSRAALPSKQDCNVGARGFSQFLADFAHG
jgi:hypothetical protein